MIDNPEYKVSFFFGLIIFFFYLIFYPVIGHPGVQIYSLNKYVTFLSYGVCFTSLSSLTFFPGNLSCLT
jgi:hypothetical protein